MAEDINPLCGDRVRVELKVLNGRIAEMKFTGFGCAISQAAASMLADLVEGLPVPAARDLNRQELLDALGVALSPARLKCAMLPLSAL